jgi:hypothetical protein
MVNSKLLWAVMVSVGLSSCASYGPMGWVYSGGTTGLSANNNVKPNKRGEACVISILAVASGGDGSIGAAKANGGISKVASVDYEVLNVLGVYGQYCTVVKGE